jgi:hypothetical protein
MTIKELLDILVLINLDRPVVSMFDFHAKKLLCDTQILHFELFTEASFDCDDGLFVFPSNDEIVDIKGNVNAFPFLIFENPDARI